MHCLICGTELNNCLCTLCGFDLSQCRERFPTLGDPPGAQSALCTRRAALIRTLNDRIAELEQTISEMRQNGVAAEERQPELSAEHFVRARQKTWECACGSRNSINSRSCVVCGKPSPLAADQTAAYLAGRRNADNHPKPRSWSCPCGSRNSIDTRYCPVCGTPKP